MVEDNLNPQEQKIIGVQAHCFICNKPMENGPLHVELGGTLIHPIGVVSLMFKMHVDCLFGLGIESLKDKQINPEQSAQLQGILMECLNDLTSKTKVQ